MRYARPTSVVSCRLAVSLGVAVASLASAAAARATVPSHTQTIDAPSSLSAVSCVPRSIICVVTDSKGNAYYATDVSTSVDGTWTKWTGPAAPSEAIACPSTSLCVFADGEAPEGGGNLYSASTFGGAWAEADTPVHGFDSVWCPTMSFCVAGQSEGFLHYATEPASSEWKTVGTVAHDITAVDCTSRNFCAVATSDGHVLVASTEAGIEDSAGWKSTDVDGALPLHGISCTSTTSCVAVDGKGDVLDLAINGTDEATVAKDDVDGTNDLTAITCTEAVCAVVDSAGNVFVSTDAGATWNVQLELGSDLTSVSCASSSLCERCAA